MGLLGATYDNLHTIPETAMGQWVMDEMGYQYPIGQHGFWSKGFDPLPISLL